MAFSHTNKTKILIISIAILLLGTVAYVGAAYVMKDDAKPYGSASRQNLDKTNSHDSADAPSTGEAKTYAGQLVCLPHKDPAGPQTLECASGIKNADGTYYGLRSEDPALLAPLAMGTHVVVHGALKAEESATYQSAGVIVVSSVEAKE